MKSIFKKLSFGEKWYNKLFNFLVYDLWYFLRNSWKFRKEIYTFRNWDYNYTFIMLRRSIELMCEGIEKYSSEEDVSKSKKIDKMKRSIEILKCFENDSFLEIAEKRLGYKFDFSKYDTSQTELLQLSNDIEQEYLKELFEILKGQDSEEFYKLNINSDNSYDLFSKWYDGTGIQGWWY